MENASQNAPEIRHRIVEHYAQCETELEQVILAAVVAAGKDPGRLVPEDLVSIDQFHIRGRHATFELARDLGLNRSMRVLDLGSGVGGASRYLAREFGCRVTGLDLCEEYCRVATSLTRRMGLEKLASYQQGDATEMPFSDGSFDLVWTQHASMNISDKRQLYAEIRRVLKPGGKLAIYDILSGSGGEVIFPVPWARDSSFSFLASAAQLRSLLQETGFEILQWRDVTSEGRAWFGRMQEKMGYREPLGLHLLLGPDFQHMARNQLRNLNEDRVALVEAVMTRH